MDNISSKSDETIFIWDERLGAQLSRATRAMHRYFKVKLKKFGLTPIQLAVLGRLFDKDGLAISEIASLRHSDNSTTVAVLDRLEEKGLIVRHSTSEDRRKKLIYLTKTAKNKKNEYLNIEKDLFRDIYQNFSEEEIEQLISQLKKITKLLQSAER